MMKYIKYSLLLKEPLRVADDSSAKQGQTMTRRYIPGSTMRGFMINRLSSAAFFPSIKRELFSDFVRFHNAYLSIETEGTEQILLPSPKGFYEDKRIVDGEKELQNVVVNGEYDEAFKRAKLGSFVSFEKAASTAECSDSRKMCFYTPRTISDTKIKLGMGSEQDIFRSTALQSGYHFTGYIALDHPDLVVDGTSVGSEALTLADVLRTALEGDAILGNARTSGYGKCEIYNCTFSDAMPYASLAMNADTEEEQTSIDSAAEKSCYMLLLSDTVMRNASGEYCGLYLPELEEALGISDLKIKYCSTSVTDVRGFNRHYGGATASVCMYEKGSVFHLSYRGIIDQEHLDKVHRRGIGVKRNEGFGQVLIINKYENVHYKQKGPSNLLYCALQIPAVKETHTEDQSVIKIAAKVYYMNQIRVAMREYIITHPLTVPHTASQLGNILSIAMQNRFSPKEGWASIDRYFINKLKKEGKLRVHGADSQASSDPVYKKVITVIKTTPLSDLLSMPYSDPSHNMIMGIPVEDLLDDNELARIRLDLLIHIIRYDFKKEVKV